MKKHHYQNRPVDHLTTPQLKEALWTRIEMKIQPTPWWKHWRLALVPLAVFAFILFFAAPQSSSSFELLVHNQEAGERPAFTLENQSEEAVEDISVVPSIAFEVLTVDEDTYEVQLTENPDPNVVYTFRARSSAGSFVWTYAVPLPDEETVVEDNDESEVTAVDSGSEEYPEEELSMETVEVVPMESVETEVTVPEVEEVVVVPTESAETETTPPEVEEVVVEETQTDPAQEESAETVAVVAEPAEVVQEEAAVDEPVQLEPTATESVVAEVEEEVSVPDVCVVNLQSFADATVVLGPLSVKTNFGVFVVKDGGVLDAAKTLGQQILVLSGGKVVNPGIGGVYYLNEGGSINVFGTFTAYAKDGSTLGGKGTSGVIYYEEGANLQGIDSGTTAIECSKILFAQP